MASIRFKNIKKTYDNGVTVINNLNLDIEDKEFVVLVGPSGCGKSTTLRMIAGLEDITEGDLYIGDTRVNDVEPKNRDIAFVFQSYALYPHMSVYKNMAFSLELRKVPKDEIDRRVREAAKILEIEEYLDRKPKALSGGQRQRVALGRAIVRNPKVFLLDEPLSNLDAKLRAGMRAQISALHKKLGTTFVYVTHDQTEAMTMGDRICVMKKGDIMQYDTPETLYNDPANLFVAGFIGSPQMNFIDAKVVNKGEGYGLSFGGVEIPCHKNNISSYVDKTVVLGVRPENVKVGHNEHSFICTVELCEHTGAEKYLYLWHDGQQIIARVPNTVEAASESEIEVYFELDKVHTFDKESELVIK